MHHFKFSFTHLSAALVLLLGLTACTPGKRTDPTGAQASYVIKEVSGYAERGEIAPSAEWRVPTTIDLGVQVCLQDRASRQDLRNQSFFIAKTGTSEGWDVQTNPYGCLRWRESLPFNYFAGRSGWVKLQREIVARGTNNGKRTIEIAVNPWAVGDHARDSSKLAVVFLRDGAEGYVPKDIHTDVDGTQFLAGRVPAQGIARMVIQSVKVGAQRESEATKSIGLRYSVDMEPRIYSQRANGDDNYEKIQDGEFDIEMQLLATNTGAQMNQSVLVLDPGVKPISTGRVIDGKLHAEFMISQDIHANQGNMELAVRITPRAIGTDATIHPFNTVYRLGHGTLADDGGGLEAVDCEKSDRCDFDKVVRSAINFGENKERFLASNPYFKDNEGYVFSNLKLGFFMVQSGETATQRTISYTASTCITDRQTGRPLADTPMVIRYVKQKKPSEEERKAMLARGEKPPDDQHDEIERDVISKNTDPSGCLNWDGVVFHKYYQPEQYFIRNIEIEKASGFKQAFTFYLNPWDTNIYFGRDKRELTAEKIKDIQGRKKIKSRFFLGNYSYHTVRFLYNIDPFMELEVKKTVLMELVPQVLRYSGIKDARKMTEHLRDGIYMMKVGIQKSYLDPRDNSHALLHNKTPQLQAKLESIGAEKLATKEFITTNMAMVRVVDGMIIYPIELTMRDLRLMRVRSNFMVELETVDERLVQAYHYFRQHSIDQNHVEDSLKKFKEKLSTSASLDEVFKSMQAEASPALQTLGENRDHEHMDERDRLKAERDRERLMSEDDRVANARKEAEAAREDLDQKVKASQGMVNYSLEFLARRLREGGQLGTYLNSSGQATGVPYELAKDASITDNFGLNQDMLEKLRDTLSVNDFSDLRLPSRDEVNLNLFVEDDSGLEPRSFVGPVIFLSNAYSDSVRATDNLDEANCSNAAHPKDAAQQARELLQLNMIERDMGLQSSAALDGNRQNNAYQYNPYFGSLSHLCYKNVDDLMQDEENLKKHNEDQMVAASLKYNFMNSFGFDMDFVSLTDEPLLKVKDGCASNVRGCLEETNEGRLKVADLGPLINDHLDVSTKLANLAPENILMRLRGLPYRSDKKAWAPAEYGKLFFEQGVESSAALCNLLTTRISDEMTSKKLTGVSAEVIREWLMPACARDGGLVHDIKYHVDKTGNYTFLGGLNLNINVGESFSMGWSKSWSAGMELSDWLGPLANFSKAIGGFILKPFSIKVGKSLSSSDGTSVSESTYLVSQIAKFELDLLGYEKCAVVRLSDQAYNTFKNGWGSGPQIFGLRTADFSDPQVERAIKRGIFVCEGETRRQNPVKRVEEMYFYFTQHFTEGDMLDQADLYNHPWLLGMRGMRDFATFVTKARLQEESSASNFITGFFGDERRKAWALDHMSQLYANVLPTFPGYYTPLEPDEDIKAFLLQQSRTTYEKNASDPFGEANHKTSELKGADGTPGALPKSTPAPILQPAAP